MSPDAINRLALTRSGYLVAGTCDDFHRSGEDGRPIGSTADSFGVKILSTSMVVSRRKQNFDS